MFFKRVFKKPPPPEPTVEKLSLAELEDKTQKLRKERLAAIQSKLDQLLEKFAGERKTMLNEIKTLSEAESTEDIHPGLYKSSLEARRLFTEKMTHSLVEFRPPKEVSSESLATLDERLANMVNQTTNSIATHARQIRAVFGSKFNPISFNLKPLHDTAKEIHTSIQDCLKELRSLDSLYAKVQAQEELLVQIDETENKTKSLKDTIPGLRVSIDSEKAKLEQLIGSSDFKSADALMEEIKKADQNIAQVEGEVQDAFSSMSRPLRKMEKLVGTGKHQIDREHVVMLKLCIQDPLSAISSEEKLAAVHNLLRRMVDFIEGGQIDLNEKERKRRVEAAMEILEKGTLEGSRKRLEKLRSRRKELLDAWEKLPHLRKSEIEKSIEAHQADLEQAQALIGQLGQEMEAARKKAEENRKELETQASGTIGKKIEIAP
ncbi:MAG: hypothetical protein AB1305_01965 [Candidatus Hadarchaeota archaeon]